MASRNTPNAKRARPRGDRSRRWCAPEALEPRRLLTSGYLALNLVSDQAATALIQDTNLVNPWGLAISASGGDLWVANSGSGVASLYNGGLGGSPSQPNSPFATDTPDVAVPDGKVTGVIPNGSTSFVVSSGSSFGPASFLFASSNGELSGYNRFVPLPAPSSQAQLAATISGAIYTGLTLANNGGQNFLYAADFHDNRIDVFDSGFHSVIAAGGFTDASLPAGFAPYNIVSLGLNGPLLVSYARQDATGQDAVPGAGAGFVDQFDLNGVLQKRLIVGQSGGGAAPLNAPWGMALAPSTSFGDFSGDLLVANHGDGLIHAFNPQTGALVGTLAMPSGQALTIDGLRGLAFGNGVASGSSNELFFSAGNSGGTHGLLGSIQAAQGVSLVAQGGVVSATANQSFNQTLAVVTDANNLPAGSFTASINWGDGFTTPGNVTPLASGEYAVSGSHGYMSSGPKSVSIQVRDSLGNTTTASALVQVATIGLSATGLTFAPTEGASFSGAVATFTDGDGNISPGAYQATIAWGDGTVSGGTVTIAGGKFTVLGTHTYAEEATKAVTVTIADFDGMTATAASTAKIADAPLDGSSVSLALTETVAFNGTVATFTDANPNPDINDFTATIDWGDGITTSGGITAGANNVFRVTGVHTYGDEGTPTIVVTVNDAGGSAATIHSGASIADADVLGVQLLPVLATEGATFSGTVATLTDLNLSAPASDLLATIDWGDGTATSGTVQGSLGTFSIGGDHVYLDEGPFVVAVTVIDDGGTASASAQATITAADGDVLSIEGVAIQPTEGTSFSGAVATVTDTLPASADGFTAMVDWGDGTVEAGTLTGSGGAFTISGTHTYARFGTYLAIVCVADDAPGTATAAATLTTVVADAPLEFTGATMNLKEGELFSGALGTVADGNPLGLASELSATIDWGDGTVNSGTLLPILGTLSLAGAHAYDLGGTYVAQITIDDLGGASATGACTFVVADYPLEATGVAVAATEGSSFSGTVATFNDTNPDGGQLSDFSAAIDWGDGTISDGTIAGSGGSYVVSGTHVFSDETETVIIVIHDRGGAAATVTAAATVADADTLTPMGRTLAATEGTAFSDTVASFTDTFTLATADDFNALIDWGDGSQSAGTVSGSGGIFIVTGNHAYAHQGTYTAQVSLADDSPGTASATASTIFNVADAPLSVGARTLSLTEGAGFSGTVATFTDANSLSSASDFTATITWGDGTGSTPGTVTQQAAGSYIVKGAHVYADEAEGLPITIVINDSGGGSATANSVADVADASLTATAVTIAATEAAPFSGTVATFSDGNPNATAADFTATIDWGDGTSAILGSVQAAVGGGFIVTGTHTYTEEGTGLPITVTIVDEGGSMATAASQANVADAPLTASKATFTATEGIAFSGTVATFTDANPLATAGEFSASIDWGDGSAASAGTVSAAKGGGFLVTGSHRFAEAASRKVTVTIRDIGGSSTSVVSQASVVDAPLTAGTPLAISTTAGALFSGTLGTFSDANINASPSDFSATIDWGDGGSTSAGTITPAPGQFIVSGSHIYSNPAAANQIAITVTDIDGATTAVLASANVASTRFSASAVTFAATEGAMFNGVIATCNDVSTNPDDFSAVVDWGDGMTATAGMAASPDGGFFITGNHRFASVGTARLTVVVTNVSLQRLTLTSQADVADAPLTAQPLTMSATEGARFNGAVAMFTDADAAATSGNFTANIDWGDGTTTSGTVTTAATGGFAVIGTHTYLEEAQGLAVTVSILDKGGAQAMAASVANVADAPLNLSPATLSVPQGGTIEGVVLATFTDEGGPEPATSYAATIDWGDGSTLIAGTIAATPTGYQITGSHQYMVPGSYTIAVSLHDEGGSGATVSVPADVPPTANQVYVAAAYHDVLARPVDAPALAYWSNQLDAGQSRTLFAGTIDHSAEYFATQIIAPAYERYLDRAGDPAGLAYWVDQMENHGLTDERLEAGFIGSAEFYARAGGTDHAWIDALYQSLLGRPADPGGETYWVAQLAAGKSRADVADGFTASLERESQRVTDDYMHYLGRQPDPQGIDYWVAQFAAGLTNEDLITGFVASDEYYEKHSQA